MSKEVNNENMNQENTIPETPKDNKDEKKGIFDKVKNSCKSGIDTGKKLARKAGPFMLGVAVTAGGIFLYEALGEKKADELMENAKNLIPNKSGDGEEKPEE